MEEQENFINPLLERVKEYGTTSYELFRLKTIDKVAEVSSSIMSRLLFGFVFVVFFLFGNIALSLWLGTVIGEMYLGFLLVAGIHFFAWLILIIFFRKAIRMGINNSIVTKLINRHSDAKH